MGLLQHFKKCSEKEYQTLGFIFTGEWPDRLPEDWVEGKRPSVFGAIKSFMNHPRFQRSVHPAWLYGATLPYWAFPDQIPDYFYQMIGRIFKGLGNTQKLKSLSWPCLLYAIVQESRFQKAYLEIFSDSLARQLLDNMAVMSERAPRKLAARIELYTGHLVRGWVTDTENNLASLNLDFFINGHYVGGSRADLYREDLKERFGGHGRFAFEHQIHLPPSWPDGYGQKLEVIDAASGTPIAPAKILNVDQAGLLSALYRISDSLSQIANKAGEISTHDKQGLQAKITWLQQLLPNMSALSALPLSAYNLYKGLYSPPHLEPIDHGINFSIWFSDKNNDDTYHPSQDDIPAYPNLSFRDQTADWHIVLNPGDRISPDGLTRLAQKISESENLKCLTCDFDHRDPNTGGYSAPHFFAAFDLDTALEAYPHSRAIIFHRDIFCSDTPISQSHIHFSYLLATLSEFGEKTIGHLDQTIFHLAEVSDGKDTSPQDLLSQQAHKETYRRLLASNIGDTGTVNSPNDRFGGQEGLMAKITWQDQAQEHRLGVIIPTRDGLDMLIPCIESLYEQADTADRLDIMVVNNQSNQETVTWLEEFAQKANHYVLDYDAPFNWSAMNNLAANTLGSERLLFLNNDTRALSKGWDQQVHGYLCREDVGALGARLLYEDGTIQHAGVISYPVGVASHEALGDSPDHGLYLNRTKTTHQNSAVTGAFLACRKKIFDKVGGFDEDNLSVSFNDLDFCFKIGQEMLKILYVPHITFQHLESKSRGHDSLTVERQARAQKESEFMSKKWGTILANDPFYPHRFTKFGKPFTLMHTLSF